MTIRERKEQLRYRKAMAFLILINIICWTPFFVKAFGNVIPNPTSGTNRFLIDKALDYSINVTEVEEVIVQEKADNTCDKKYTASQFKRLGKVRYGNYTYTWYSQRVLPGRGLNKYIKGRHVELIDGLGFVCNEDGYVVVASDDLPRFSLVALPIGRMGIVIDTGSGKGNIDIYTDF